MLFVKKILFFLIAILFFSCASSTLNNTENAISFEVSYLKENKKNIGFETVKNNHFTKLNSDKLGVKNGWYWFKIELKNQVKEDKLVFNIDGNTIDSITFFNDKNSLNTAIERLTLISHSYKIPHTDATTYYAKVHFVKQAHFPLKIFTLEEYYKLQNNFFFTNGLFYGFVIIVLIVNLVFYFTLKDVSFLAYAAFLGLTNLAITDFDGLMALYTSTETRFWLSVLLHFIVPLSTAIFTSILLNHHNLVPKSLKITAVLLVLSAISYISFVTTNNFMYSAIGDLLGLCIVTYYMYLGICELKKQKFAKFTVFGYSLIWVSSILFMMPLNLGFDTPSVTLTTVKTGSILEMLVLTYSIVYRVKLLHIENKKFSSDIKKYMQQIFALESQIQEAKTVEEKEASIEEKVKEIADTNQLTEREADVLQHIIYGFKNTEIAEKLFISVNTVKYHIKKLYEKLDIKKRGDLSNKILFQ